MLVRHERVEGGKRGGEVYLVYKNQTLWVLTSPWKCAILEATYGRFPTAERS